MRSISFRRSFSAAHRLWTDDSKCWNIHGHNYEVELEVQTLSDDLNEQGFVIPFSVVKNVIDFHDHALILDAEDPLAEHLTSWHSGGARLSIVLVEGPPSTENLARMLAEQIANAVEFLRGDLPSFEVSVHLRETEGIEAHAHALRNP